MAAAAASARAWSSWKRSGRSANGSARASAERGTYGEGGAGGWGTRSGAAESHSIDSCGASCDAPRAPGPEQAPRMRRSAETCRQLYRPDGFLRLLQSDFCHKRRQYRHQSTIQCAGMRAGAQPTPAVDAPRIGSQLRSKPRPVRCTSACRLEELRCCRPTFCSEATAADLEERGRACAALGLRVRPAPLRPSRKAPLLVNATCNLYQRLLWLQPGGTA